MDHERLKQAVFEAVLKDPNRPKGDYFIEIFRAKGIEADDFFEAMSYLLDENILEDDGEGRVGPADSYSPGWCAVCQLPHDCQRCGAILTCHSCCLDTDCDLVLCPTCRSTHQHGQDDQTPIVKNLRWWEPRKGGHVLDCAHEGPDCHVGCGTLTCLVLLERTGKIDPEIADAKRKFRQTGECPICEGAGMVESATSTLLDHVEIACPACDGEYHLGDQDDRL